MASICYCPSKFPIRKIIFVKEIYCQMVFWEINGGEYLGESASVVCVWLFWTVAIKGRGYEDDWYCLGKRLAFLNGVSEWGLKGF